MSGSTKSQFYRYTMRSVAVAGRGMCTDKHYLYPVPPQDAITIEGLFCHIRVLFDSSVAAADRVIQAIGVTSERPLFIGDEPAHAREQLLNLSADANRRIDLKIDLTHLLTKENVGFTPLLSADYEQDNMTFIYLRGSPSLRNSLTVGTIEIWKADSIYTTREIR